MENGNVTEITEWVIKQLASLDPAEDHAGQSQPDPVAALQRFHVRRAANKVGIRRLPWATWIAAAVLAIASFFILPLGRAMAQQLWQLLTVRQVAFIRVGSWPDGVRSPPVQLIGTILPPIPARDLSEAQWRVNYPPRLPRSGVLSGSPRLSTTFSMSAGTVVNVADLQLALRKAGVTDQTVPSQWQGAQLALHSSAVVLAEWPDILFAQSLPLTLSAPPGFDFSVFSTLILRILGVEPAEARRLAMEMGTAPLWLAPLDRRDFDQQATMERIVISSGPATLVQELEEDGAVKRTSVFWSVPDRVFLLSGKLSRELAILTAEAVQ